MDAVRAKNQVKIHRNALLFGLNFRQLHLTILLIFYRFNRSKLSRFREQLFSKPDLLK